MAFLLQHMMGDKLKNMTGGEAMKERRTRTEKRQRRLKEWAEKSSRSIRNNSSRRSESNWRIIHAKINVKWMRSVDCSITFTVDLLTLHQISFLLTVCSAERFNQSHMFLLSLWTQWPIRGVLMNQRGECRNCSALTLADWEQNQHSQILLYHKQ